MSWCYFIGAENGDVVKIGWAINPNHRLSGLQTGNPVELALLAVVRDTNYREREAHFHSRFSESRIRGEWFRRTPELDRVILMLGKKWDLRPTMPEIPKDIYRVQRGDNEITRKQKRLSRRALELQVARDYKKALDLWMNGENLPVALSDAAFNRLFQAARLGRPIGPGRMTLDTSGNLV